MLLNFSEEMREKRLWLGVRAAGEVTGKGHDRSGERGAPPQCCPLSEHWQLRLTADQQSRTRSHPWAANVSIPPPGFLGLLSKSKCAGFSVRGGIPLGFCALVLYGTLRALRASVAREARVELVFKANVTAEGQNKKRRKYVASEQTNNQEAHQTHIIGT